MDGAPLKHDALRAQRLAAPAKVYVEQFSAHPLESDAAELYGPPDGYIGADGVFRKERRSPATSRSTRSNSSRRTVSIPCPIWRVRPTARPGRRNAPRRAAPIYRQGFFPDGSRSFEEIDRLSIGVEGTASLLSSIATIDFYRGVPPGGFTKGLPAHLRTDKGEGDIPPEVRGTHYFGYKPYHLGRRPAAPGAGEGDQRHAGARIGRRL